MDTTGLTELARESANGPGKVITAKLDVTRESQVTTVVEHLCRAAGGLNALINSAGILQDGLLVSKNAELISRLPSTQWRRVVDTNLTGGFLVTREVVAWMLKNGIGCGVIVNMSSLSRAGHLGQSMYAASKAGLDAATKTWALELAQYGIRVGAIAPGMIDTPMLRRLPDKVRVELLSQIPAGAFGSVADIWMAVKFAIECDYFNGKVIEVDGGASF